MTNYAEEIDVKGIKEAVEKVFEELFSKSGAVLDGVFAKADYDHDGDPVLRVLVVFEAKGDKLDVSGTLSFHRYFWERLEALDERRYPIISFVTKAEKKERDAEIEAEAKQIACEMFEGMFSRKGATLADVSLRNERHDGRQILRVKISFEAEGGELDPSGVIRFKDNLEYFMETANDYRLPVIEFIRKAKGRRRQKEARHEAA